AVARTASPAVNWKIGERPASARSGSAAANSSQVTIGIQRSSPLAQPTLLQPTEDRPLDRADAGAVTQSKRLVLRDPGLGDHAWSGAEMWPRRAMNQEWVAQIHVAGAASCTCPGAFER